MGYSSQENIIEFTDVSMLFNLSSEKVDNIKEYIIKSVKRKLFFQEFWALKNINFTVAAGESLGVIGLNGSGKSTLLKLIAGIMRPTLGSVMVKGMISPLIELGTGFDHNLSARENVYLNGAILGYQRSEIQEHFTQIIDFADLWDFVDTPIKNYSSGMVARLGFSIATMKQPDILIVDEILEVGDYKFRQKCNSRMDNLMSNNTTIIMVSHAIEQIQQRCDRVIWLEKGHLRMMGPTQDVCEHYLADQ